MTGSVKLALTAIAAAMGGALAHQLDLPLAWLIGAILVTAMINFATGPVTVPPVLYRTGQVVVGVAVGLSVPGDMLARLGPHLILIPLAALISILIGWALSPLLARFGRLDRTTAYFALVPAGITEMADQAGRRGADIGAVASFHTFRVLLVVILMPLILVQVNSAMLPAQIGSQVSSHGWTLSLAAALAVGLGSALLARRLGLPAAFILGAMLGVGVLSGSNLLEAQEPPMLLAMAQILLGLSLGARFQKDRIRRLPRALAVGVVLMLCHGGIMAGIAILLALGLGLDANLMVLGLANGGAAEMVLTAQTLAVDASLVAVYQVIRAVLGNALSGLIHDRYVAPSRPVAWQK